MHRDLNSERKAYLQSELEMTALLAMKLGASLQSQEKLHQTTSTAQHVVKESTKTKF
jgi:hypothetical protein